MKHPVYFLRPNKSVDRLTLFEAIKRLEKLSGDLTDYTYYGLGGPYLEDFRLLYELCPEIKMVSIEKDKETVKRQHFHLPCSIGRIQLKRNDVRNFITQYQAADEKSIFWLDYTGLEYGFFQDFIALLGKISAGSMVKITLRAEPRDFIDKAEKFREQFTAIMPDPSADPPRKKEKFVRLVQDMIEIAAQKALPGSNQLMFQIVSSFYYSDGSQMLTLTGVVCMRSEEAQTKNAFREWKLANLNWSMPKEIDVPVLSTKERLHLQNLLPCDGDSGKILHKALGYLIDDNQRDTQTKLEQYANFHRYFPYFIKAIP